MSSKFQGRSLYNATLLLWRCQKYCIRKLDLDLGKHPDAFRMQSERNLDVHSSTGTISFRVNSGGAADIYRVWMGDVCVFSMGNLFKVDQKQNYDDPGFSYAGGGWATSGSASEGDDDVVEVLVRASLQLTKFISGIAMLDLMVQCTKTRMSMILMEMGIPQKLIWI